MEERKLWSVDFFFQAEDGIRDYKVTGVQTCALPICVFCDVSGQWSIGGVLGAQASGLLLMTSTPEACVPRPTTLLAPYAARLIKRSRASRLISRSWI